MAQRDRTKEPKRLAELEAQLRVPPFPEEFRYLWRAYLRMRNRMAPGFAGSVPLGWSEIDAFVRNSRLSLAPWEIEVIEALDDAFMAAKGS